MSESGVRVGRRIPWHGVLGLLLGGTCWWLNWSLAGLRTHLLFFPLWLGYVLVVDAAVARRASPSPLQRDPLRFAGLFVVSVPAWWLFEAINLRTANWIYLGRDAFSDLEHAFFASLSFSTVIPAVFVSAELVRTLPPVRALPAGPRVRVRPGSWRMAAIGALMLAALLAWPRYFFPCVWLSVWFVLEPLNERLGHRSLLPDLRRGDWRSVVSLGAGALLCGFFWELWNWRAYPKWIYDVPFVDFLHVFEMPLLGYGGYPVFGLELFALYQLVAGLLGRDDPRWPRL